MLIHSRDTQSKGIRSIQFLLHTILPLLAPYADVLLEVLIEAKNGILKENINDLSFLSRINLRSVMNKTVKYSRRSDESD